MSWQKVKKYRHSVNLSKSISVSSASKLDDNIFVATTDKKLLKFNINADSTINGKYTYVHGLPTKDIKFVGFMKGRVVVLPKDSWDIYVLDDAKSTCNTLDVNSDYDLKECVMEAIHSKNHKSCKCHECYNLIGFGEFYGFNLFVQSCCKHNKDQRSLYVIKANMSSFIIKDIEIINEYNYYTLCTDNGISDSDAHETIFTNVYYDDNKVYLLSTNGKHSNLWKMLYYNNISYLGPPEPVARLSKHAKGMYAQGGNLIIFSNSSKDKKLQYYLIEFCDESHKNSDK